MKVNRKVMALSALVLGACDDALVGRLPPDASVAPVCDVAAFEGDAATRRAPTLAYGGESASDDEKLEGRVNAGHQFEVTADCLVLTDLGVWDHRQDGLSRAHAVTLFSLDRPGAGAVPTPVVGGEALVGAGSDVPLEDGFRLARLAAPLALARGYYAIVAYDFSSEEPYGGGLTLPDAEGPIRDLSFGPLELAAVPSPAYPSSAGAEAYSAASFRYVIAAPSASVDD